jgi:ATP-binding cassette subfamily F protein 3
MLTAHRISKSYSINQVLVDISFSINSGERVGLIGPNGCGKTTLLRILAGMEKPDRGAVTYTPNDLKIGYLAQGSQFDDELSIEAVLRQQVGDFEQAQDEVSRLAAQIGLDPGDRQLQTRYVDALRRLEQHSYADEARRTKILEVFGFSPEVRNRPVKHLSGGQKTRLGLALLLLEDPDLLLLDEPTNHLDISMLEWLEEWLSAFPGAIVIVSHDRAFLDNTVSKMFDLNPETHSIKEYTGNYSAYLDRYLHEIEKQADAYREQESEVRRLKQDIARTKQQAYRVEITTTSRQPTVRRYAKKVARKAKSRQKKLDRYLQSEDRIEKPGQSWQMNLQFDAPDHQSQDVLILDGLSVGYPPGDPLIANLELYVRSGSRIAFTGVNGSGKTTLLRTLAGLLEPLSGSYRIGGSVKLGYMSQEQELLKPGLNALETIQRYAPVNETEARSFLHNFLFYGDDALRPVETLSYGERARLALAQLVVTGSNFLLLDEPINHLDIPSRERFEQALSTFAGTVLAVVHDRYFIQRFATELWILEEKSIHTHPAGSFRS